MLVGAEPPIIAGSPSLSRTAGCKRAAGRPLRASPAVLQVFVNQKKAVDVLSKPEAQVVGRGQMSPDHSAMLLGLWTTTATEFAPSMEVRARRPHPSCQPGKDLVRRGSYQWLSDCRSNENGP